MKNVKVLASIAALATVSCMAAVSASAASSIKFELDAAKSNKTTKYVNMILETDEITNVQDFSITMDLPENISGTSLWNTPVNISYGTVDASGSPVDIIDNKIRLVEFKIEEESFTMSSAFDSDWDVITPNPGFAVDTCEDGSITVVNAEDAGLFTQDEGAAVKAFTAKTAGAGTYTWHVTDGNRSKTAVATDVNGESDVIIGLTVTGEEVADITYAAITID